MILLLVLAIIFLILTIYLWYVGFRNESDFCLGCGCVCMLIAIILVYFADAKYGKNLKINNQTVIETSTIPSIDTTIIINNGVSDTTYTYTFNENDII